MSSSIVKKVISIVRFDKLWGRNLKPETREAVQYLFKSFTYVGINPPLKYRALYYLYLAATYLNLCGLTQLLFNLTYFLGKNDITTSQLLTSLQAAINIWGIPPKMITMTLSLSRLRRAEQYMATLDARCSRASEIAKICNAIKMGSRVVVIFCLIYGIYGMSTFVGSVAVGQTPYSLYVPFLNWHESTAKFCQQAAIEFVVIFFLLYHQVVYDCYPVIYIYILRTHMQILVERVRRLGTDAQQSKQQTYAELVQCIVDHQCILNLYDSISSVISITVFVQFLITAAILGITLINILIFADTSTQIGAVLYFMAVLSQISPTCYQATCLMNDSDQLPLAIFQCNWLEQDKRFRKMLIFFMQRAQNPLTLTAMKLFPITLSTNLSIAKFSFSLYTLIKEMDLGQNFKK